MIELKCVSAGFPKQVSQNNLRTLCGLKAKVVKDTQSP